MKRILPLSVVILLAGFIANSHGQADAVQAGLDAITKEAVQGQLEFLASDWTEGRNTGQKGAYLAADYIASMFKVYGLEPGGDVDSTTISRWEMMQGIRPVTFPTYFQNINMIQYEPGEDNELSLQVGEKTYYFNHETDFEVEASDISTEVEAPVVFVGYGYVNDDAGYNDFKGVDVKDKIILRLYGYPGYYDVTCEAYKKINENRRVSLRRLSRSKNNIAREKGALAIIEVNLEKDETYEWISNTPFRYNTRLYEGDEEPNPYTFRMKLPEDTISSNPPRITVSKRVMTEITKSSGLNLKEFAEKVKTTVKPASKEIAAKVRIKTSVNSKIVKARNVIGVIPGKDPDNIIVLGAHYDHLGIQDGYIWNGADDNASGTVGVMTIAKAIMAAGVQPEYTIVFCAWTGEEKGLLGSTYFVDHPYKPVENIKLYMNYDMISRDSPNDEEGNKIRMEYTKGYSGLEENVINNNEKYEMGLDISFQSSVRPRGGSDHTPFAQKDIPIFYFMAGFPREYHEADDHVSLVNWDKMVKIIKLGYLNIWKYSNNELMKEETEDKE